MPSTRNAQHRLGAVARGVLVTLLALLPALATADETEEDSGAFRTTKPVFCTEIRGYEDFDLLPKAEFTQHQKLLIYFKPLHFKTNHKGARYEAYFTQDGKIHRRGEKATLLTKSKMEFRVAAERPLELIYLKNTYALRDLKPGEYDYEIILRDEIGKGAPAVVRVPFTIVATPPEEGATKEDEPKTVRRR
jgi:hypothetical protein